MFARKNPTRTGFATSSLLTSDPKLSKKKADLINSALFSSQTSTCDACARFDSRARAISELWYDVYRLTDHAATTVHIIKK